MSLVKSVYVFGGLLHTLSDYEYNGYLLRVEGTERCVKREQRICGSHEFRGGKKMKNIFVLVRDKSDGKGQV